MAYTISAQLRLQTPSLQNINKIRKDVEGALSGLKLNINNKSVSALNAYLRTAATSASKLSSSLQDVGTSTRYINTSASSFNKVSTGISKAATAQKDLATSTQKTTSHIGAQGNAFDISRKKMFAYLLGGAGIRQFAFAIRDGIRESIKFQTELSKVGIISNLTAQQTIQLGSEIRKVAAASGAAGDQIAQASKLLASAGFNFQQLAGTAKLLAKINVGASFDSGSLESAADAIILLNSVFKQKDPKEYASSLEKINNLANKYAVDSKDLVQGLAISGSAAAQAQLSFSELASILTVVRSKTRESSETVATSIRNSIIRINRYQSIDILRSMGIDPVDAQNRMRPMFQIFEELASVVKNTASSDVALNNKLEDLFGQRQVSRMLPLLTDFGFAIEARNEAMKNGESLDLAATRRMDTMAGQLQSLKEKWLSFTDDIVNNQGLLKATKDINTLSDSLLNLISSLSSVIPALGALAAFSLGRGIGKKFGTPLNMDMPQASRYQQSTRQDYLDAKNTSMLSGRPDDIAATKSAEKIMKGADAQYLASRRVVLAQMRMVNSSGVLEKSFYGAKYGVQRFTQSMKLNARLYATGALALAAFAISMQDQTPKMEAAFNVVTVGLIAVASGLSPFMAATAMITTAILSYSKAIEKEKKQAQQRAMDSIDQLTHDKKELVFNADPQAEAKRFNIDVEGLLAKAAELKDRAVSKDITMGFVEYNAKALGNMLSGNWGSLTKNAIIDDRSKAEQESLMADVNKVKPEVIAALSKRAEQLGSTDKLRSDPMAQQLYATLKLFDVLNGTVGETDRLLQDFTQSIEEANAQYIGGRGSLISNTSNINARANAINKNANSANRNQDLSSIPLSAAERNATSAIDKAFETLPQILGNIQFNSKEWQNQLTDSLISAGFDRAIIGSIETQLDNLTFEEFAKSLSDTTNASNSLLTEYDAHRAAIESLIDATKNAANVLKEKLTAAFEAQANYLDERSKYLSQQQTYSTFLKQPTDPTLSNRTAIQDSLDISGTADPAALGAALTAYQTALDNQTVALQDIPRVEDAITRTKNSLAKLADVSSRLASVEARRSEVLASKEGKLGATEQIIRNPLAIAKQMIALKLAMERGITNLPEEMRNAALDAMDTFGNVKLSQFGGMTGQEIKNRVLSVEAEKFGMSVKAEDNELVQLNALSNAIQQESLQAQYQLMTFAAQTANNTARLAAGRGFAAGGIVSGTGTRDTVPALLTPGEFVLNRKAVQNIGTGKLNKMNRTKFANGGVVTAGATSSATIDLSQLVHGANIFKDAAKSIVNAAEMLRGLTIQHTGQFSVEVIHNGATMFNTLSDSMKVLIENTVKTAINNMLSTKFALPPME